MTGLLFNTIAAGGINIGDLTTVNGQLILPFSGFYAITFSTSVIAAAAGTYQLYGSLNAETVQYGSASCVAASTQRVDLLVTINRRFTAGDVVHFNALQVTGGAINIGSTADTRSRLTVIKLSD